MKVSGSSKGDSFDIPYRILADYYYLVPGRSPRTEGKPALLSLRDFNGDGVALETAFFEALACMGLPTTLIGYSPKRDRILQYPVVLRVLEQKQVSGRKIVEARVETITWVDYVFSKPPLRPGYWFLTIDYRGRGGSLATYDVHYEAAREQFAGTLTLTPP